MKRFSLSIIIFTAAFFAALNVSGQNKACQVSEPLYRVGTISERHGDVVIAKSESEAGKYASVRASKVIFENTGPNRCEILSISLQAGFEGGKIAPTDEIEVSLTSVSKEYLFKTSASRKLVLLANDKTVFSTSLKKNSTDPDPDPIKFEFLRTDTKLSFANLKNLADARKVTIRIGKREFSLTEAQAQAITDFFRTLNVADKNTARNLHEQIFVNRPAES